MSIYRHSVNCERTGLYVLPICAKIKMKNYTLSSVLCTKEVGRHGY